MRTIVGQRTGELISPSLATLLLAHLTELGDVGRHVTHIVEGKANHIGNVGQCTTTGSIVEALFADVAVDHRHEGQTAAHERHGTAGLLAIVVDLIVEGGKCEDGLSRCCAHLLKVSQTGPVEHLLGIGFSIGKGTAAVTGTHRITIRIGNGEALGTHDHSLVEQATGQRRLTEGTHATTTGTLSEDRHVVGVAAKLLDIFLNPFQGFNLVENTVVA